MPALTWRNVDAPDFRTSLAGFEQFSNLISNAFGDASQALQKFDDTQVDQTSKAAIADLLTKYQGNPDQLTADLASGAFTQQYDPKRLNAQALDLLARRPQQLLDFATGKVDLADKTGDVADEVLLRGRRDSEYAASEAARPAAVAIAEAASRGDRAGVAALRTQFKDTIGALPIDQIFKLATSSQGLLEGDLNLTGKELDNAGQITANKQAILNLEEGTWEYGNKRVDRAESRLGVAAGLDMLNQGFDVESARAAFNDPKYSGLSAASRAIALQTLQGSFGNIYAPDAAIDVSSAPSFEAIGGGKGKATRGIRNNNPGNLEYGKFTQGLGATGSDGRFAIFPTFEAGVEAQERLLGGSRYLGGGKDTILKIINKYAPSSENHVGNYAGYVAKRTGIDPNKKLTQSDIPKIASAMREFENGGQGGSASLSPQRALIEATARVSQNDTIGTSRQFNAKQEDISADAAARRLVEGEKDDKGKALGGAFKNVPVEFVRSRIQDIVKRSKVKGVPTISYSEAGVILEDALRSPRNAFEKAIGFTLSPNLGNGSALNEALIEQRVKDARRGQVVDRVDRNEQTKNAAVQIQAAAQAAQAARNEYQSFLRRAASQPGILKANGPRLQAKLLAAEARLEAVRRENQNTVKATRARSNDRGDSFSDRASQMIDDLLSGNVFSVRRN